MKKLNDDVHCSVDLLFVPGTANSIVHNTYKFDTLKINKEVVNAEELYNWLKKHYEPATADDGRSYVCTSMLY